MKNVTSASNEEGRESKEQRENKQRKGENTKFNSGRW
jgi:hypothetical protein